MRVCKKCGGENKTKTQDWCTSCKREYDREYYTEEERKKQIARVRERKKQIARWAQTLKDEPCTDCGQKYHFAAMQWDHLPGCNKVGNLAKLIQSGSKKAILEEVAKCELVCANCHAIRTWRRMQALVA